MSATKTEADPAEIAMARSDVYKALAALMDVPTEPLVAGLQSEIVILGIEEALALLAHPASTYEDSVRSLADLRRALKSESLSLNTMRDEHMRFGRRAFGCPPYETEYGYSNVFQKTNAMADIAGFYRAFGVDLNPDSHEQVDCITTELEFMHVLLAKEAEAIKTGNASGRETCVSARKKFMAAHLARWTKGFAALLRKKAEDGLYPLIAAFVACFVGDEAKRLGLTSDPADFGMRCDDKTMECGSSLCGAEKSAPSEG